MTVGMMICTGSRQNSGYLSGSGDPQVRSWSWYGSPFRNREWFCSLSGARYRSRMFSVFISRGGSHRNFSKSLPILS